MAFVNRSIPGINILCSVCKTIGKYEIDDNESMSCLICGTISENYLSQSQDVDDGGKYM
jgi:hypothetical protein